MDTEGLRNISRVKKRERKLEPAAFSVPETAEMLGMSDRFVARLVRDGELRSLKIGRRRIIPRDAVEELLDRAGR